MIVDDSIEFRFQTRTLSEDYRVFADGGEQTLNYAEEFEPLESAAEVAYDEERSAVVFENDGSVYVSAFGLKRNAFDRAGREIRFSFCLILPSSEKQAAMRAFSRLVKEWNEAGEEVSRLIKEIPVPRKDWKGRDTHGEDVSFDYQKFFDWLVSKPANYALPKAGAMLKWLADTGEPATRRMGKTPRKEDEEMPGLRGKPRSQPKRNSSKVLLAVLCVLVLALGAVCLKQRSELKKVSDELSNTRKSEADLKSKFESADAEIFSLKERLATAQTSLDVTTDNLDKERQESKKWKKEAERLKRQQGTGTSAKH